MTPRDCLLRYPLFALLKPHQLDNWLDAATELQMPTGEIVFQEGRIGIWAYVILEGKVRVLRKLKDGPEKSLGTMTAGHVFGEYAVLDPGKFTATCRVAEDARLLRLPLAPMKPLYNGMPTVQSNLKKWLRLHALLNYLRGRAFLGFMSATSALLFLNCLQSDTFHAGHTIQATGLSVDHFYFIEDGQVELHTPGDEQPRLLGAGDCFGAEALATRKNIPIATALTDIRCQYLCYESFLNPKRTDDSSYVSGLQTHQPTANSQAHPWVGQEAETDCGVAALAMITRHFGMDVSVNTLRHELTVGSTGATLLELKRVAELMHLPCQAIRIDMAHLDQIVLPVIAHQANGHYVVIYQMDAQGLVIGDPATSVSTVSRSLFERSSSGSFLVFGTT